MQPTPEQIAIITQQLGKKPRGIASIAIATPKGVPVVIQMRSFFENAPFPTLYWLSSLDLCRAISRIEASGWIKMLEVELQLDADLKSTYLQQQQDYVDLRWNLMHSADKQHILEQGFETLFNTVGIGGIAHWEKVRCLHMQYAHHLVADNVIGQRMDSEFGLHKLDIRI